MGKIIHKYKNFLSSEERENLLNQKAILIWFTGISGSGKSTLANLVSRKLHMKKIKTYEIDGDNLRDGINNDLSFSDIDRRENIRRAGEIAKLFVDSGLVTLASFISPFNKDRSRIRELIGKDKFVEVYVKASVETCIKRDPKKLYHKAMQGQISNFTGISSNYEIPLDPDLVIDTEELSIEEGGNLVVNYILPKINVTNK